MVMIASPAAHLQQAGEPESEIVGVVELVADGLLGLGHVRRDHRGLGAETGSHLLAFSVEHGEHAEGAQLGDQARVQVLGHPAARCRRERRSTPCAR